MWGTFSQFPSGLRLSPLSQSDFQLLDGEKHLTCLASVNIPVFPRWTLAQQEEVESHPEVCTNANKLRLDSIFFFPATRLSGTLLDSRGVTVSGIRAELTDDFD